MPLDHSVKRLPEHEEILKKYGGDIHSPEYHKELYNSNMKLYRHRHKERIQEYNREYQRKYRENKPYLYGLKMWNKHHPDCQLSLDEYIEYRKQKEQKRLAKLEKKKNEIQRKV